MSETKFTKGPWKACRDAQCPCGYIWGADGNTTVARAYGPADLDREGDGADQVPAPHVQLANAALISSAPELYEALAMAERWLAEMHSDADGDEKTELRDAHSAAWKSIDQMRAALRRARGESGSAGK